jgi:hypothetical protein
MAPISKDAMTGPGPGLFHTLDPLTKLPNGIYYGELKRDPYWEPLRKDPRYESCWQNWCRVRRNNARRGC